MIRLTEIKLPLTAISPELSDPHPIPALTQLTATALGVDATTIAQLTVFKRSFDARKADLQVVYIVDVALHDAAQEPVLIAQHEKNPHIKPMPDMAYRFVTHAPADVSERPVVVGFGPCGMFAALVLAQMGFKPIVLERGATVRQRTKDTWGLWRKNTLKPTSTVQFGEGGAGTFSDGKLYSQIKDPRFLGRKVMEEMVKAGAPANILYEAHPHIGTFKLVKVVESIREQIIALGGEVRFGQQVVDLKISDLLSNKELEMHSQRALQGVLVENIETGERYELPARHVIMGLGHSARDSFSMLYERGVAMQAKPFSIGFRIEHPQSVIDRARWGRHAGHPMLGAADYKLVHHANNGRSVYSFCMCPGGTVVAATSEAGRVVTNGMSQYSRNERNANAGIVVGIEPPDYPQDEAAFISAWGEEKGKRYFAEAQKMESVHPLAGVNLQRQLESNAYILGGSTYEAPGQLVGDFLASQPSTAFGDVQPSYKPGVKLGDLAQALPEYAITAMREALPAFGKKIKGFDMPNAMLTGVETRTSSPLKIPRGDDYQSINTAGLYPSGEGASYAGGILSAAVDGIKVAEALAVALVATVEGAE